MKHKYRVRLLRRSLCAVLCGVSVFALTLTAFADESRVMGDVDGDGTVTSGDALAILRHSVGISLLDGSALDCADMDGDGEITSSDALAALQTYIKGSPDARARIVFPETYEAVCGERLNLKATMEPADVFGNVKFEYLVSVSESTDGLTDEDDEPYKVLDITNTGKIKAFHPGTATVKAVAPNGMKAVCTVTVKDVPTTKTIKSGGDSLKVTTRMMTNNDCYNETDDFTQIDGVVVHSTATPGVDAERWYIAWNKPGTDAAVHAFLDDKQVCIYLPLEQTAWHAGQPANRTYLDFEICEPGGFYYDGNDITDYDVEEQTPYFNAIWKNAALYTAYLCSINGLDETDVISHNEAAELGIGTNHGDPDHWFIVHDRDMDDFRADVAKYLRQGVTVSDTIVLSGGADTDETDDTAFDEYAVVLWDNE